MNVNERSECLEALAAATNQLRLAQASIAQVRAQSHGEVYEQVDLIAKRVYELKIKAEWLRYVLLGKMPIQPKVEDPEGRQDQDRRVGIDRRVAAMQQRLQLMAP